MTDLIEIDNDRYDELYNLARQLYPNVADYFIHLICNEQCVLEAGHENKELADELYQRAKNESKTNEYYFNVEHESQSE